jgi:hypothetical protein
MRNINYKPLIAKFVLAWMSCTLFWILLGGTREPLSPTMIVISILLVAIASAVCYFRVRWYRDEVAEQRLKQRQCIECAYSLSEEMERCPECGTKV